MSHKEIMPQKLFTLGLSNVTKILTLRLVHTVVLQG